MKRLIVFSLAALMSATLVASVFVSPPPAATEEAALLAGTEVEPLVLRIIQTSCQNCHSTNTEWPWYSHIAPLSWMIERDVLEARSHMDLSHWQEYDVETKRRLLATIGSVVRNGIMPPTRYTTLHPEAKLSSEKVDALYRWTKQARKEVEGR